MEQIALITGASKRVGKAITEHLAEKGWNIIIHFNNSSTDAEVLKSALAEKYPTQKFSTVKANLSLSDEVFSVIPNLGKIDLLVNNASIFDKGYLTETSEKLFDSQINVNLKAPYFLMRDFANHCKVGNIINFVDTRITSNKSNFAAYSLSKKGLWELTKMAALEFAPRIRVNAIAPGATLPSPHESEGYLEALAKTTPMQVPSGLEPILKSIDYILQNEHLTGQLLFADGGENLGIKE